MCETVPILICALSLFFKVSCLEVRLEQGRYEGIVEHFENVRVERFLGIPYAQSPIGDLRFRKTKPITTGSKDLYCATDWPPNCLQDSPLIHSLDYQSNNFSEDCLYLNVWTPRQESGHLRPVLFYIHGGAYILGSSSQAIYNALPMAAIGSVVVVTFNYRLGAMGFVYGGDDLYPGNLAVYDQIEALKWVRRNIEHFGGDPDRITVFGESAGSISTGIFLLSQLTQHIFRNAIMMSGAPLNPLMIQTRKQSLKTTVTLAKRVGCARDRCVDPKSITKVMREIIDCLQKVNATRIIKEQDRISSSTMPFSPFFGSDILEDSPAQLVQSRSYKRNSSIMIGTVTYEGSVVEDGLYRYPELQPILANGTKQQWADQLRSKIDQLPGKPPGNASDVVALYFKGFKDDPIVSREQYSDALGDYYLLCPTLLMGERLYEGNKVFSYLFTYKSMSKGAKSGFNLSCTSKKVCHANELFALFGNPLLLPNEFDADDRLISREMIKFWSDFARHDRPGWPPYRNVSTLLVPVTFELDPNSEESILNNQYKSIECSVWKSFLL